MGKLPAHRLPTEAEWAASGLARTGWPAIGPDESRRDHPGYDKIGVLPGSPQVLDGRVNGTVGKSGIFGVHGPPDTEKCKNYIAAVVDGEPAPCIVLAS